MVFKVKKKKTVQKQVEKVFFVCIMGLWLDIHKMETDLLCSLICSNVLYCVYSRLRIHAYINQLNPKYKRTIDIFIVPAWFKESIFELNPRHWAFLEPLTRAAVYKIIQSAPVQTHWRFTWSHSLTNILLCMVMRLTQCVSAVRQCFIWFSLTDRHAHHWVWPTHTQLIIPACFLKTIFDLTVSVFWKCHTSEETWWVSVSAHCRLRFLQWGCIFVHSTFYFYFFCLPFHSGACNHVVPPKTNYAC